MLHQLITRLILASRERQIAHLLARAEACLVDYNHTREAAWLAMYEHYSQRAVAVARSCSEV